MKRLILIMSFTFMLITLMACQRETISVKVTLMLDDNEVYEVINLPKNTEIDLPLPEKEGYYFVGWYKKPNDHIILPLKFIATEDQVLYAQYEINYYLLEFDTDDGLPIDAILVQFEHPLDQLKFGIKKAFLTIDTSYLTYTLMTLSDQLVSYTWIEMLPLIRTLGHVDDDALNENALVEVFHVDNSSDVRSIISINYAKTIQIGTEIFTIEVLGEQPSIDNEIDSQSVVYTNTEGTSFDTWILDLQHKHTYRDAIKQNNFMYLSDDNEPVALQMIDPYFDASSYLTTEFIGENQSAWQQDVLEILQFVTATNMDLDIETFEWIEQDGEGIWFIGGLESTMQHPLFASFYELLQLAYGHEGLNQPYKKGYQFLGWYIDNEFTQPFDLLIMPGYDLILYAKWEAIHTQDGR